MALAAALAKLAAHWPPVTVSLVGAGPGDPGLITAKGLARLLAAEVVLYDYLAAPELLALLKAGAPLDAFVQAASTDKARSARNGFAYVLSTVKGQMQDAAAVGSDLARQPRQHVQAQSFRERDRIAGMQRWEEMTGQKHPDLVALGRSSQPPVGMVIDIETAAKRIAL